MALQEDLVNKIKRQATRFGGIFAKHITTKDLCLEYTKKKKTLEIQSFKKIQVENGQRAYFTKEEY